MTNSDEIYRFDGLAYGIRTHLLDFKPFLPWGRTPEPTCIICFDLSDHILYKTGTFSITGGEGGSARTSCWNFSVLQVPQCTYF